jgi:hypothetical protein
MNDIIINTIKASDSYTAVTRYFSVSTTYLGFILLISGVFIGITKVENKNDFGVIVLLLIIFTDKFQWMVRQITTLEALMINYIRIDNLCKL